MRENKEKAASPKTSVISIIAVSYTIVSLSSTIFEGIMHGELNDFHRNTLTQFFLTIVFVFIILSQQYFTHISPLIMGVLQFAAAEVFVLFFVWISSFFLELHPNGYRDMFITTAIPFMVSLIFYYMQLHIEVRRQNKLLARLRSLKKAN